MKNTFEVGSFFPLMLRCSLLMSPRTHVGPVLSRNLIEDLTDSRGLRNMRPYGFALRKYELARKWKRQMKVLLQQEGILKKITAKQNAERQAKQAKLAQRLKHNP